MYQLKGAEMYRHLVWGFTFIWLRVRLCSLFAVAVVAEAKISCSVLVLCPLLSLDFPRDTLNIVWDVQFFQLYSPLIIHDLYIGGGKVCVCVGGWGQCSTVVLLGLILLLILCPWSVIFISVSKLCIIFISPLKWDKRARGAAEVGYFPSPHGN